jgi:hypothetical protein
MESLLIKPTPTSLAVSLDAGLGKISFIGRSVSEHSVEFFKPVIDWLEKYAAAPLDKTECLFKFEYFNSSARKSLVEIFKILFSIHKKGKEVVVIWSYDADDESMKELGEEYENMFSLNFHYTHN